MTVNGVGNATDCKRSDSIGGNMQMDSISRNLKNQIANAQKKLQKLSSNQELSLEEKMKKRQEIQQEISSLTQQLRQHQIELRKQQQNKSSNSVDELTGAGYDDTEKNKGGWNITGQNVCYDFSRFSNETGTGAGKCCHTDKWKSRSS